MRTVVNSSEVAHLWAHQAQPHARNSNNSFYFRDSMLFSWGSHYTVARILNGTRGRRGILLNKTFYSVSTSSHQGLARRAIDHDKYEIWDVYDPSATPKQLRSDMIAELRVSQRWLANPPKGTRKTTIASRYESMLSTIDRINEFAEFYGLRNKPIAKPADYETARAKFAEIIAQADRKAELRRRRAAKEYERRLAEQRARAESILARWIAGDNVRTIYVDAYAKLRLSPSDASIVETSLGASVPADHVRRVLPFVLDRITKGEPWQSNGQTIRVGHYTVDRITDDGTVRAGCHLITADEVRRFAAILESTGGATL